MTTQPPTPTAGSRVRYTGYATEPYAPDKGATGVVIDYAPDALRVQWTSPVTTYKGCPVQYVPTVHFGGVEGEKELQTCR